MPKSADFEQIYQKMIAQYGKKKGEKIYYSWVNVHHYDDTKPFPGKKGDCMSNDFSIYGTFDKVDEEQRMVYGYATTEAIDSQGEVIALDATRKALDGYSQWRNIREMHQPKAIGVAPVLDMTEKGLYIGAKIVDDSAWIKVKEGVLKGFSIGGKCKLREVENRNGKDVGVIKEYDLNEISLVDRPANPEAMISLIKVDISEDMEKAKVTAMEEKRASLKMSVSEFYAAPRDPPSESALPIFDEAHVRNAMARFNQTQFKDDAEKEKARHKILAAAKKFGIEVQGETNVNPKKDIEGDEVKIDEVRKEESKEEVVTGEVKIEVKPEFVSKVEYDALKTQVDEIRKSIESKDAEIKKLTSFGDELVKKISELEPKKKVLTEPENIPVKKSFKELAAEALFKI